MDPRTFREAASRHASGVVVVTAAGRDGPVGFTATSFTAVSLVPPLVSFYLGQDSTSWPSFHGAGHFAVNMLAAGQEAVAARFARRGVDRFGPPTRWSESDSGLPLLHDVTTRLVCRQRWIAPVGDHFLVIGTVIGTHVGTVDTPLLYAHGRFARLVQSRE